MRRWRYLLLASLVLWLLRANAQPLFRCEHYWIVNIQNRKYGLEQVLQIPDDFRWTQVWIGRYTFNMRCRSAEAATLLLLPPMNFKPGFWCRIEWSSFRRFP